MRSASVGSFCLLWLLLSAKVFAQSLPWQQLESVGQAQLKFFFWPVYEARLYSDSSVFDFPDTRPFALALEYRRAFARQDLIKETRQQWQAIGADFQENWLEQLSNILVDVGKGDVITLYVNQNGNSEFYLNDSLLGVIDDAAFSNQFAAIWLSDKSTRPDFRAVLLGRE